MTKQDCILPSSHVGEHLLALGFGFEPMTNLIILSVKKHPPGLDIKLEYLKSFYFPCSKFGLISNKIQSHEMFEWLLDALREIFKGEVIILFSSLICYIYMCVNSSLSPSFPSPHFVFKFVAT